MVPGSSVSGSDISIEVDYSNRLGERSSRLNLSSIYIVIF